MIQVIQPLNFGNTVTNFWLMGLFAFPHASAAHVAFCLDIALA